MPFSPIAQWDKGEPKGDGQVDVGGGEAGGVGREVVVKGDFQAYSGHCC